MKSTHCLSRNLVFIPPLPLEDTFCRSAELLLEFVLSSFGSSMSDSADHWFLFDMFSFLDFAILSLPLSSPTFGPASFTYLHLRACVLSFCNIPWGNGEQSFPLLLLSSFISLTTCSFTLISSNDPSCNFSINKAQTSLISPSPSHLTHNSASLTPPWSLSVSLEG